MIPDLLKAPLSRLVIFLCVLTLLACPGALVIWMLTPDQFKALNSFHLVVLSVALVMPFIIFNIVVVCWSFPLHRWITRKRRNRVVPRPREAVVAAASVFAGAVAAIIPAYSPILAHVFGMAAGTRDMARIAIESEIVPFVLLLLIDPTNYWQGIDGGTVSSSDPQKKVQVSVELHIHRQRTSDNAKPTSPEPSDTGSRA